MVRQRLLSNIGLPVLDVNVTLALHCCLPSGAPAVVAARSRIRELCLGTGYLPGHLTLTGHVVIGRPSAPIPLDTVYVGSGVPSMRVHPSPWCNPFAAEASCEAAARAHFWSYAGSRADLHQWLLPLAGKVLIAEPGLTGRHAHDLRDLIEQLVNLDTHNS